MDRHGHELELPGEEEDDFKFAGSVCGCDEDSDPAERGSYEFCCHGDCKVAYYLQCQTLNLKSQILKLESYLKPQILNLTS